MLFFSLLKNSDIASFFLCILFLPSDESSFAVKKHSETTTGVKIQEGSIDTSSEIDLSFCQSS